MGFAAFRGHKYLNLETFRKSGEGVKTPVWFAAAPTTDLSGDDAKLYVYTIGNSGKVKRIRNNGRVRLAPCNVRGGLLGDWTDGQAEIAGSAEAERGTILLRKKYFPWKQLLDFFGSFRKRELIVFIIRPK